MPKPDDLTDAICQAIDRWHSAHPNLMVSEIVDSLAEVREKLMAAVRGDATRKYQS